MKKILSAVFGDPNAKEIKKLLPIVEKINSFEEKIQKLSDDELKLKTSEFKQRLKENETLDDLLPEAFAVVREVSKRVLGQRQYDVQMIGGIALHRGWISEMRTGEGKTLTAVAPMYLNALLGRGAHLVTVNDYLSRRDTVWMGQVFYALDLSIACVQHASAYRYDPDFKSESKHDELRDEMGSFLVDMDYLRPIQRQEAYLADITYGTNNEFGFDYLRDNMVAELGQKVQRDLHYAIIDEVDSILIDEARTPLIISAPAEDPAELYYRFADLVPKLAEEEDYIVDEKQRTATLTAEGIAKMEKWLGIENLYVAGGMKMVHHMEQALRARALFKKDKDYVVQGEEVIIVDEFTGRLMQGRRYSEGLHQAIEAKEHVKIQRESVTMATITFQNLFRMYEKLSGMTGTAETEAEEFHKIYKLEVLSIPTNKPNAREDLPDRVFKNERGKFTAVLREIKERHATGQPILVGTASIEKNELLGELMKKEGIPCDVLNAKNHEREGEIIAQAGRRGAVTVATNMAGRGVDIVLGGNPADPEEAEAVKKLGGLFVLGTERHESRRIDNQLRGRAGRQGDAGTTQFYVSMDDDLIRIFGADRAEKMKSRMDLLRVPEDEPIENSLLSKTIESAQRKVEGHNFDIRKHLLEYDDVINKHRTAVYKRRNDILKDAEKPTENGVRPLTAMVREAVEGEIEQTVLFHTGAEEHERWDLEAMAKAFRALFPSQTNISEAMEKAVKKADQQEDEVWKRTAFVEAFSEIAKEAYGVVESQVEEDAVMGEVEKMLLLRSTDDLWVEHLEAISHLRKAIGLSGYGQRDPLVEYKREAYRLYHELLALIDRQVAHSIFKIQIAARSADMTQDSSGRGLQLQGPAKTSNDPHAISGSQAGSVPKVGRNEECPCGSGKKYKKCHGA
ncbi:MAG: preprotein translocase subunit SecA [bacterium]|nr:preprotein translocase subunit SecA [bacterium]